MNATAEARKRAGARTYDAARTKMAILDAAEEQFAELGYSAARIDAIAKASGYNKSLIYQYFGDKLGLYTEVVKRADQLGDQAVLQATGHLLKDESLTSDAAKFRKFLEVNVREMYRLLRQNPRYRKILFWEAAEEWKTWNQISYRPDDLTLFRDLAKAAVQNGILRRDLDPGFFPILLMNVTVTTLLSLSRFGELLGDTGSPEFHELVIAQIERFIVSGMMEPSVL